MNPWLYAVDPGGRRKGNAEATFTPDDELARVEMVDAYTHARRTHGPWLGFGARAIVERPQKDGRVMSVETVIDLSTCAALAGGSFLQAGAELVEVTPWLWKGVEPKAQMHYRAWNVLTTAEQILLGAGAYDEVIEARKRGALARWAPHRNAYYAEKSRTPDKLDAACLGLWYLGRLATFPQGRGELCFRNPTIPIPTLLSTAVASRGSAPRRVTRRVRSRY
jgi:hypothetical protein